MTDLELWRSLGSAATAVQRKVAVRRVDHPNIEEQTDAVEWAEDYARRLASLARLGDSQNIGLGVSHEKALTVKQLDTLRARLEAAAETLRTLQFGSEIAR